MMTVWFKFLAAVRRSYSTDVFVLLAVLLCRLLPCRTDAVVTVDPHRLTIEVGKSNNVSCSAEGGAGELAWLDPAKQPINSSAADSRIWYDPVSATLVLNDAEETDSGGYACVLNRTNCVNDSSVCSSATFQYKVYVMPDYAVDGLIILVVNGVLLLVFIACLIHSMIAIRRRLGKYGQKI